MAFPIVFARGVFEDEQEIFRYYECERSGLGEEFLEDLEEMFDRLKNNPEIFGFADVCKVLRKARTTRFPYIILYEVRVTEVLITRLFHEKRDVRF